MSVARGGGPAALSWVRRWWIATLLAWTPLLGSPETGDPFMGTWGGDFLARSGDRGPFRLQVVPRGGGSYSLWVRMGDRGSRYEIAGIREDGRLRFRGRYEMASGTDEAAYELTGEISAGRATGTFTSQELNGTIQLQREIPRPPSQEPPPPGATLLFGGRTPELWLRGDGGAADWKVLSDGSLEAGAVDLVTAARFAGFRLHVEFLLPLQPEARGRQRGNGGVIVGGAHEVLILDSFAQDPTRDACGAIVGLAAPRIDACHPPLAWQEFDITFRPLAAGAPGARREAEITVLLNGLTLHERRRVGEFNPAPIRLRAGGSPVRFRNVWILPLAE